MNEKIFISIPISLKLVPKGATDSKRGLQVMARRWTGNKHYLNNADPIQWSIYVALGGDELINHMRILTSYLFLKGKPIPWKPY